LVCEVQYVTLSNVFMAYKYISFAPTLKGAKAAMASSICKRPFRGCSPDSMMSLYALKCVAGSKECGILARLLQTMVPPCHCGIRKTPEVFLTIGAQTGGTVANPGWCAYRSCISEVWLPDPVYHTCLAFATSSRHLHSNRSVAKAFQY
jgi:hypothetical protein